MTTRASRRFAPRPLPPRAPLRQVRYSTLPGQIHYSVLPGQIRRFAQPSLIHRSARLRQIRRSALPSLIHYSAQLRQRRRSLRMRPTRRRRTWRQIRPLPLVRRHALAPQRRTPRSEPRLSRSLLLRRPEVRAIPRVASIPEGNLPRPTHRPVRKIPAARWKLLIKRRRKRSERLNRSSPWTRRSTRRRCRSSPYEFHSLTVPLSTCT